MDRIKINRMGNFTLVIARIALGYLFFTQLFWKMPPTFGCPDGFAFTTGSVEDGRVRLQRTSGLCDWVGIEAVWANQPRPFFVADMTSIGGPRLSVDLGWLARLNGIIIENVIMPNIAWMGWLLWGAEAFIALSLFFGLFTRLGGLVAIGVSAQLMIGLSGISNPFEWEWAYIQMVIIALVIFGTTPGRVFGLDAMLRPRLKQTAEKGNRLLKGLLFLT
jgi:hypothetical protein